MIFTCTLNIPGKGSKALINANPVTKKETEFVTTADAVDYLLLAENYKFDFCTAGISDESNQVTLMLKTNVTNSQVRNKQYTRTLNVDCILLVPHDTFYVLDELPNTGTPGILMFPHGLNYGKGWYMLR